MGKLTNLVQKIRGSLPWNTNKQPAYRIHRNGVEVQYFDLSKPETLPFDRKTFSETQVFLGEWANPWYFDFDKLEDEYPNFDEKELTRINNVFEEKHVYPSQKWKTLAHQSVLSDMYASSALNNERVIRLLYLAVSGIGFAVLLLLFGGA